MKEKIYKQVKNAGSTQTCAQKIRKTHLSLSVCRRVTTKQTFFAHLKILCSVKCRIVYDYIAVF